MKKEFDIFKSLFYVNRADLSRYDGISFCEILRINLEIKTALFYYGISMHKSKQ